MNIRARLLRQNCQRRNGLHQRNLKVRRRVFSKTMIADVRHTTTGECMQHFCKTKTQIYHGIKKIVVEIVTDREKVVFLSLKGTEMRVAKNFYA